MFNPWLASLKAVQMGVEAQSVLAIGMLRLATGGARLEAEASRMVTDKVDAAAEPHPVVAVSALNSRSLHVVTSKAPRAPKKRVRASKRRLSHQVPQ
jgi:hypothetical protein